MQPGAIPRPPVTSPERMQSHPPHTTKETEIMRTNSKAVRDQIRAHILASVTDENGDPFATFPEASARLRAEFARVANYPHNLRRLPNNQERFQDYLMGIPFGFEFTHSGIAAFLKSLGINPTGKEYDPEKSARLYSYLIFREI